MKTKIILFIIIYGLLSNFVFAQNKKTECGTWDAIIISIEKAGTKFIVTGENMMPDCSPSGIYFEWWADSQCLNELKIGMKLDFDKFRPKKGYWKYKDLFTKNTKNTRDSER